MICLRVIWQRKWGLVRLGIALYLLALLLFENPSRLARREYASLPPTDYKGEARKLANEGRFGEALIVIDAGQLDDRALDEESLVVEKKRIQDERDSGLRKLRQFATGFIIGDGESLEALAGTVTADLFIVGDLRDIAIQGTKHLVGDKADDVVLLLSGIGVLTTFAPHLDAVASFLKIARKAGAMTKRFAEAVVRLLKKALDQKRLVVGH